jgi:hypothetical protein
MSSRVEMRKQGGESIHGELNAANQIVRGAAERGALPSQEKIRGLRRHGKETFSPSGSSKLQTSPRM